PLSRGALAMREMPLPAGHPDISTSLNNLAVLYQEQGRLAEAEPLYKRALAMRETALPAGHPNIATSLNNLAFLYQAQGRLSEAEPLYKRALAMRETALPDNHPDLAASLGNLSLVHLQQGRFDAALELERRATAIFIRRGQASSESAGGSGDIAQNRRYFWHQLRLVQRLAERDARDAAALQEEAFRMAQLMLQSKAAQALSQMSARFAAAEPALGALVRERQDLQSQW